jgi:hypothetical protein
VSRIDNKKLLVIVVAAAAVAAAYWFVLLAPKRQEAADLGTQVAAKQLEAQQAQQTLASYQKSRDAYKANYSAAVQLGKAVPADDDVRSLLVQLDSAAGATGVDFRTVQIGTSTSSTPAASAAPVAGAATPPPGAVSVGSAGFSAMPFTFAFRGSFFDLSSFFTELEHFVTVKNQKIAVTGRLVRVETISLVPDPTGFPRIRAEVGASSYLVPSTQGLTGGATPQGPAAATTTPASSGGGSTTPVTTATAVNGATR